MFVVSFQYSFIPLCVDNKIIHGTNNWCENKTIWTISSSCGRHELFWLQWISVMICFHSEKWASKYKVCVCFRTVKTAIILITDCNLQNICCQSPTNIQHSITNTAQYHFLCFQWQAVISRTHRCQHGYWILQIPPLPTRISSKNTAKDPV